MVVAVWFIIIKESVEVMNGHAGTLHVYQKTDVAIEPLTVMMAQMKKTAHQVSPDNTDL